MFKKLLIAVGLAGVAYWFAQRFGRRDDEFTFTEYPNDGSGS